MAVRPRTVAATSNGGPTLDLALYRRHAEDCKPGKKNGRGHTACSCPIWCDGMEDGRRINKSVGTRDWGRAEARLREWQKDSDGILAKPAPANESVGSAVTRFLRDCSRRNIAEGTIKRYRYTLETFAAHCAKHEVQTLGEVTMQTVRDYHIEPRVSHRPVKGTHRKEIETITRVVAPTTARKELETLRGFFRWLIDEGALTKSPAAKVKPPVMSASEEDEDVNPMPFSPEEIEAIFLASDELQNNNQGSVEKARKRAKAIVYTMLYSGLRISDVAALARKNVDLETGRFMVRTIKSRHKTTVRGKLPRAACEALKSLPVESPFFFCSGAAKPSTTRGSIRRTIDAIMTIAGIRNGNPHRFRHTFATRLLTQGTRIELVAELLGHKDIRVTTKHYKHWVPELQVQAEAAVEALDFDSPAVGAASVRSEEPVKDRSRNTDRRVITLTSRTA